MSGSEQKIREVTGAQLPATVLQAEQPLVLKGLVRQWPLVQAGMQSDHAADQYLRQFYNCTPVTVSVGPAAIGGRIFYNEDLTGFNFETRRTRLDELLDELARHRDDASPPVHYLGSTSVDAILPGLRDENDLPLGELAPAINIWLGNQSRIAAHYDVPDNIACVVVGRRRFTLFPPEQLQNLYVGPLDFAPAGQAISLVDVCTPDFDRYPKFRLALEQAQVADLMPGDAIFIPGMWWHHVQGLDSLNVLINYWWRQAPAWMGNPLDVLHHALLSLRDLPEAQRRAWQGIFEHYIFQPEAGVTEHIPEAKRGVLSPIDALAARRLRALLLKQLNR